MTSTVSSLCGEYMIEMIQIKNPFTGPRQKTSISETARPAAPVERFCYPAFVPAGQVSALQQYRRVPTRFQRLPGKKHRPFE